MIIRVAIDERYGEALTRDANPEPVRKIAALMARLYWTRAWILQEAALARSGLVLCGAEEARLEDLWYALTTLRRITYKLVAETGHVELGEAMANTECTALEIAVGKNMSGEPVDMDDANKLRAALDAAIQANNGWRIMCIFNRTLRTPSVEFYVANQKRSNWKS